MLGDGAGGPPRSAKSTFPQSQHPQSQYFVNLVQEDRPEDNLQVVPIDLALVEKALQFLGEVKLQPSTLTATE